MRTIAIILLALYALMGVAQTPPFPITHATITGKIRTPTSTPVTGTIMNLTGTEGDTFICGNDGGYRFDVSLEGDYSITPVQAENQNASQGITTLDLLLIRSHILATLPITSPYRLIAADVDGSRSVSTIDFLLIRSIVLQMNTAFPNGKVWTFVRSDYSFPVPSYPFDYEYKRNYADIAVNQLNQDFTAIKMGDVNYSWDPNSMKKIAEEDVHFFIEDHGIAHGQEVIVQVKVKDFSNITGYQFTISWDAKHLLLADVINRSVNGHYGRQRTSEGLLAVSWDSETTEPVSLNDNSVLFDLKFMAAGENGGIIPVNINSALIPEEAYNGQLAPVNVVAGNGYVKLESLTGINERGHFSDITVFPNPFRDNLQITLPGQLAQGQTRVEIYDIQGRLINTLTAEFESGQIAFRWNGETIQENMAGMGIYYLRIASTSSTHIIKVVKAE